MCGRTGGRFFASGHRDGPSSGAQQQADSPTCPPPGLEQSQALPFPQRFHPLNWSASSEPSASPLRAVIFGINSSLSLLLRTKRNQFVVFTRDRKLHRLSH